MVHLTYDLKCLKPLADVRSEYVSLKNEAAKKRQLIKKFELITNYTQNFY